MYEERATPVFPHNGNYNTIDFASVDISNFHASQVEWNVQPLFLMSINRFIVQAPPSNSFIICFDISDAHVFLQNEKWNPTVQHVLTNVCEKYANSQFLGSLTSPQITGCLHAPAQYGLGVLSGNSLVGQNQKTLSEYHYAMTDILGEYWWKVAYETRDVAPLLSKASRIRWRNERFLWFLARFPV